MDCDKNQDLPGPLESTIKYFLSWYYITSTTFGLIFLFYSIVILSWELSYDFFFFFFTV